jgi:hypothetical protein
MYLFLRLLLGHLVGDFVFQTDKIYRIKMQSLLGQVIHALIVGLALMAFAIPYIAYPQIWFFFAFLILLHLASDLFKNNLGKKIFSEFWIFIIDQIFHVIPLLAVFLFEFSAQPHMLRHPWLAWYNSNCVVVILIGYLTATFAGTYFLDALKRKFIPAFAQAQLPKSLNYFLIERALIFSLFGFAKLYFLPLALLVYVPRLVMRKNTRFLDFALNLVYTGALGIVVRVVLSRG